MTETIGANVDNGSGRSPLSNLMSLAMLTFGDSNIDHADGALAHLLLLFANLTVSEINAHPYREGKDTVLPYVHPADKRDIPDLTMIAGIAAKYASQQGSAKAAILESSFYQTMNRELWMELNGNTRLEALSVDREHGRSRTNGLPTKET